MAPGLSHRSDQICALISNTAENPYARIIGDESPAATEEIKKVTENSSPKKFS
jgi:hypothetical protein